MKQEKMTSGIMGNKAFRCTLDLIIGVVLMYFSALTVFAKEPFSFFKVLFTAVLLLSAYLIYKSLLLLVFGYPKLKINGNYLEYNTLFKKQRFQIDKVFITKQRVAFERYIFIKVDNKKFIFTYYSLDKEFRKALGI